MECKEEHSRHREQHRLSQGPKRTPGRMSEMRLRKGAGHTPLTTPKLQYLLKDKSLALQTMFLILRTHSLINLI